MAVTKRTRFEVFRRDEHTCQYCGGKAPDVTLTIDHVMPVALGGDDKPGNLVTACRDCNAGKTSITPDSPLVQGLSDRAAAYALGMLDKMTKFRAEIESFEDYEFLFLEEWNRWVLDGKPFKLPLDYKMSLFEWKQMGVPSATFELVIPVAIEKFNRDSYFEEESTFRYMAGVLNTLLNRREIDLSVTDESVAVYTKQDLEANSQEEWSRGLNAGRQRERLMQIALDPLRNHIDGTEAELTGSGQFTRLSGGVVFIGTRTRKYPD